MLRIPADSAGSSWMKWTISDDLSRGQEVLANRRSFAPVPLSCAHSSSGIRNISADWMDESSTSAEWF